MSGREGKADFTGAAVTSALCHPPEVSRFIDHFVGALLLNKASWLQEQKASAVLASSSLNMASIVIRPHLLASVSGLTGESKRNLINIRNSPSGGRPS
jgi:hypothetical protein